MLGKHKMIYHDSIQKYKSMELRITKNTIETREINP